MLHVKDSGFLDAANSFIPMEPELWVHPENEKYAYAWHLPQMRVGEAFDIRGASRALVLEWVYRNLWIKLGLNNVSKNTQAAALLLRLFMLFPTRRVTFMIQRVILALGKKVLGSPGNAAVDGIFGEKTRGAIYSELSDRYEPTRMALYAEVYSELQSFNNSDEALWGPILEAYVTRRI
ncbi:hypothetical protein LCGC14_0890340 [marine sediment metagenome]|uniref:Uncharacterized protein n=1 Tax=marine sediment metagenome TaxID=412755 RepID=A0A0F9P496_9ZZZZ